MPKLGLKPGGVGVVVHALADAHAADAGFEVELMSLDGRTLGVQTLDASK